MKLPTEVRRLYSLQDEDKEFWHLKCDQCADRFLLKKPQKGEKIAPGDIFYLLNHVSLHETAEVQNETPSPQALNHVSISHTLPSKASPICYKVEQIGTSIRVSHFRDPLFTEHRQVKKTDTGYVVVLFAANPKHAALMSTRLIKSFKKSE